MTIQKKKLKAEPPPCEMSFGSSWGVMTKIWWLPYCFCPCVIGHLKLSDSSHFYVYSRRQLKVFSAILWKEREKPDLLLTVLTCKNYRNHVFSSNQVACNGCTVSHLVPNVDFLWILNLTLGRTARQTDSCHPLICTPSNSESAGQQAEEGRKECSDEKLKSRTLFEW